MNSCIEWLSRSPSWISTEKAREIPGNSLDGGVQVVGKAPTKTERRQLEKKRLKEEKKLLLKEIRNTDQVDMLTPGPEHTLIKQKLQEIQKGEKRTIQEVLDLSKQRIKRRRKESVQCKYSFSTHIQRYLIPSIELISSLDSLSSLFDGEHTVLFFSVYNTSYTSFDVWLPLFLYCRRVSLHMMISSIITFPSLSLSLFMSRRETRLPVGSSTVWNCMEISTMRRILIMLWLKMNSKSFTHSFIHNLFDSSRGISNDNFVCFTITFQSIWIVALFTLPWWKVSSWIWNYSIG